MKSREEFNAPSVPLLTVISAVGVAVRNLDTGRTPSEDLSGYRVVRPGDLVVNKLWARFGAYGVSSLVGIISPAYWVLCIDRAVFEPRFLHHLLRSDRYRGEIGRLSRNLPPNGYDLSWDQFRTLRLPAMQVDEQRRIAAFPDDQVALLDRAVVLRQQQLRLTSERLAAVVDLGVAGHYTQSRKVSHLLTVLRDGTHTPPARVADGVRLLTAKNVREHIFQFTDSDTRISYKDADQLDYGLKAMPGDVLLSIKGSVGNVGLVPEGTERFTFERNLALFRVRPEACDPHWLYFALRSRLLQDQVRLAMTFSAQPGIYLGALANLQVPLPTLERQRLLISEFQGIAHQAAAMQRHLRRSADLLVERKHALITAAVTGEFDVTTAQSVA